MTNSTITATTLGTEPRRNRKRIALALTAMCALSLTVSKDTANANERIVTDWQTGIAISGYDPVAYFVERQAVPGRDSYQAHWGGVVWQFRSAGNRDAFIANPDVYAPEYGGHDATAIADGFVARGNPLIWTVADGELHLFNSADNLYAFQAEGSRIETRAAKRWSKLSRTLALR